MAAKKTATKPVEAVKEDKVVETTGAESKAPVEAKTEPTKPVEAVKPVKVYNFISANKFLTVTSLGVQFIDGKASVTDVAVARALATIDGVQHIED
jgi:hypothetical protein